MAEKREAISTEALKAWRKLAKDQCAALAFGVEGVTEFRALNVFNYHALLDELIELREAQDEAPAQSSIIDLPNYRG